MRPALGSRKRFLYRLVIYSLAPWVGLYVVLAGPDGLEGRLLGMIGIAVGGTALLLLVSRLTDPRSALRYALCPVQTAARAVADWRPESGRDPSAQRDALRAHLARALPDVVVEERRAPDQTTALALGEELLVCLSTPPATPGEVEALHRTIGTLRTPLREESLLLVLTNPASQAVDARLKELGAQLVVVQ